MNTKKTISIALMVAAGVAAGWLANGMFPSTPTQPVTRAAGAGPCPGGAEPVYWKAPMDPSYVRDAPGKSPMGMDLLPVCEKEGDEFALVSEDLPFVRAAVSAVFEAHPEAPLLLLSDTLVDEDLPDHPGRIVWNLRGTNFEIINHATLELGRGAQQATG